MADSKFDVTIDKFQPPEQYMLDAFTALAECVQEVAPGATVAGDEEVQRLLVDFPSEDFEATDRALGDLVAMAAEQEFTLVAMLIPSEIQIDPVRWQAGLEGLGLDPQEYEPQAPTRVFKRLLADHGIPTLDLTEPFAEGLGRGDDLYFRFDRHWTVAGHALAAERLAGFLAEQESAGPTGE